MTEPSSSSLARVDLTVRGRVFPSFDPTWIVHRDADVVVVDKPAGMVSIESEPGGQEALYTRLAAWLGVASLPVLSRLDRETSGLVAIPLSTEATRALAAERGVLKRYVAAVQLADGRAPTGRLEDTLVDDGERVVVRDGDRRGKRAVSHTRVRARRGRRALLDVTLETGRTHQIRVQLAHRGAPIAGDALYGDVVAPRMLLHCTALELDHPTLGRTTFERPPPACFDAWLGDALGSDALRRDALDLAASLGVASTRRYALAHAADTTAFRLVSEGGDGVPGLAVDVYGDYLLAHFLDAPFDEARVLDALDALGFHGVYVKRRPKKAQDLSARDLGDHAPAHALRGTDAPDEFVVLENGLPFAVRLGDGMSTGIFLDQRAHRARVRSLARGARVLNLFAYTCGFTVAAAAGGASETISVDAAKRALERGRANLALAGLDGAHRFIADDAFDVLAKMARRGEQFDLVCVDPPTFSTTRSSRWTSGGDWERLLRDVLRVTAPGGRVLATSNDRRMSQAEFRAYAKRAARSGDLSIDRVVDLPAPTDFRAAPGAPPLLKALLIERS